MLTNGKKVWGIWNPATRKFFTKNGEVAMYDDINVARVDLAGLDPLLHPDAFKCYVKIISNGTQAEKPTYPHSVETKIDYNHQSKTAG